MKTMICLILDRSGSMQGREGDVIGGVNKFLEEQKALPLMHSSLRSSKICHSRPSSSTICDCGALGQYWHRKSAQTPMRNLIHIAPTAGTPACSKWSRDATISDGPPHPGEAVA